MRADPRARGDMVLGVTWAVELLERGPEAVGIIDSAFGVGAIVGGLLAIARASQEPPRTRRRDRHRAVVAAPAAHRGLAVTRHRLRRGHPHGLRQPARRRQLHDDRPAHGSRRPARASVGRLRGCVVLVDGHGCPRHTVPPRAPRDAVDPHDPGRPRRRSRAPLPPALRATGRHAEAAGGHRPAARHPDLLPDAPGGDRVAGPQPGGRELPSPVQRSCARARARTASSSSAAAGSR